MKNDNFKPLTMVLMGFILSLFLTSCGSSSGSSNPNNQPEPGHQLWQGSTLQSITPLSGTWIQGRCTAITGGSVKIYYFINILSTTTAQISAGNLFYSGVSNCTGTALDTARTLLGDLTFLGTDQYATKKYYYSELKMVSGLNQNFVLAFKDLSTLCFFNRTSDLGTSTQVDQFVTAIDQNDCSTK